MIGFMPQFQPQIVFKSQQDLHAAIVHQFEYYFSVDNLVRDLYLRSLLDHEHAVPLFVMVQFNRVMRMTTDINVIVDALKTSNAVEVLPGNRVRRRHEPEKFPFLPAAPTAFGPPPSFLQPPFQPFGFPPKLQFDLNAPEYVPSAVVAPKAAQQPVVAKTEASSIAHDHQGEKVAHSSTTAKPESNKSHADHDDHEDASDDEGDDDWERVKAAQPVKKTSVPKAASRKASAPAPAKPVGDDLDFEFEDELTPAKPGTKLFVFSIGFFLLDFSRIHSYTAFLSRMTRYLTARLTRSS